MQKPWSRWMRFLYGPMFKVIGVFYRSYTSNRARVARLKSNKHFALVLQALMLAMLLGWIVIWYFAPENNSAGLVEEVKQSINGTSRSFDP